MGLFDIIECEYPIPDDRYQNLQFQTKDLECLLDHYTITRDGRLMRHAKRESHGPEQDVEWPYHGDICIYDSDPDKAHQLLEYVVRFTHGHVEWIRCAGDAEREPCDPIQVPSPAADMQDRLMPDEWGRRLKVDEYISNSPEKLELIDGAIPGTDELLLLLLTGVGLRRAVRLVGADRWRKALGVNKPDDL